MGIIFSSFNGLEGKVPELRFSSYDDSWTAEKLSDFTVRVTRKNSKNQTDLPLTISSKDGLVDQVTFFNKKVSSKDMSGYYLLQKGEFAYNKSYSNGYDFGSIKRLERYEMGALSTLYICFALTKYCSDYIRHYFDSLKWYRQIYIISAEGARNHGLLNVPTDDFFATTHYLSQSLSEQEKIAAFLSLVDARIEKQRQLVESLKKYKRGVIQYYFDNILGERIKLKNILIEVDEKTKINNQHPVISSTKQGLFWQEDYFNKDIASSDNKGYKILRKGQVVFSPQNLWMGNINYNEDFEIGIVSPSYKIYDINKMFDPYFVSVLLKTPIAMKEFFLASEQGASIVRRNLNMDLFENITFQIPSLDKQKDISIRLYKLQKNLDLNIKILDYLIKFKQGLLQQMFI